MLAMEIELVGHNTMGSNFSGESRTDKTTPGVRSVCPITPQTQQASVIKPGLAVSSSFPVFLVF